MGQWRCVWAIKWMNFEFSIGLNLYCVPILWYRKHNNTHNIAHWFVYIENCDKINWGAHIVVILDLSGIYCSMFSSYCILRSVFWYGAYFTRSLQINKLTVCVWMRSCQYELFAQVIYMRSCFVSIYLWTFVTSWINAWISYCW